MILKRKTVYYLKARNGHSNILVFASRSTLCSVMAQLTEDIQPSFDTTLKSKAVSENCNVKFTCVVSGRSALNSLVHLHASACCLNTTDHVLLKLVFQDVVFLTAGRLDGWAHLTAAAVPLCDTPQT